MSTLATTLMTAAEFYDFVHRPENRDRVFELERGEVVEMSRPGKKHGLVCANVAGILRNYAIAVKKGYVCSNDTGVVVERDPDTVRGPEVTFFEDVGTFDEVESKFGETPPLLAVEVLSPTDNMGKVNRRIEQQLSFGTSLVWLLDPDSRTATVYRIDRGHVVLEENAEITGEEVLTDFKCRVTEFFAMPGR